MLFLRELLSDDNNAIYRKYKDWLIGAKPGDRYVYFTGNCLADTILGQTIGEFVMNDAYLGNVYLVQKKRSLYVYDYIAIKAPSPPTSSLVPYRLRTNKKFDKYELMSERAHG